LQERTDAAAPPPLPGALASLPRIFVSRLSSGATTLVADAYEVDRLEKAIEAFELRERSIASQEWRSKAEGGPGTAA
ncbi:MAG TPA: hypothetical protein VF718_10380, partial [Allosphingosinicella sp.]